MSTASAAWTVLLTVAGLSCLCGSQAAEPGSSSPPKASWVLSYRSNGPERYHGLSFPDATNGWMVGDSGKILHTRDGGLNWEQQSNPLTFQLTCVQFASARLGWAAGVGDVVLRTSDGGRSWVAVNTPSSSHWPTFMALQFVDEREGWICDNRGGLLHTQDGGKTWVRHNTHSPDALVAICFVDKNKGWVLGVGGTLLQTTNAGRSWTSQRLSSRPYAVASFRDVFFLDATQGWVGTDTTISSRAEDTPPLFRTTDGGRNWSVQAHWPGTSVSTVRFWTPQLGRCAEMSGIYTTTDGGVTWAKELDSNGDPIVDMVFIGTSTGRALTFTGNIYSYGR